MRYRTIVADPPWEYEQFQPSQWKGREWRLEKPYPSMSLFELGQIDVLGLADKTGCRLFCWTTNRYLHSALNLIELWGFTYKQAITWSKTGNVSPFPGHIAPQHSEYLLVATFGKVERLGVLPSSVIEAPKAAAAGSHSKKPELFLDLIESVSPGPYLEMFARRNRLGWDTWGNEALEHVEVA